MSGTARSQMLQRLQIDGYTEAKVLYRELGVDPSTIRRDLDTLMRSGQAGRTPGGARAVTETAPELPDTAKRAGRQREKPIIAHSAAERVGDRQAVILGNRSTSV